MIPKRNPIVVAGKYVNIHRREEDGLMYPAIKRPKYTKRFGLPQHLRAAAEEMNALAGLVKKDDVR